MPREKLCFLGTRLTPGQAHLVLDGVGKGRLWDCSRARCWLASVGGEGARDTHQLSVGTERRCTHRLKALELLT